MCPHWRRFVLGFWLPIWGFLVGFLLHFQKLNFGLNPHPIEFVSHGTVNFVLVGILWFRTSARVFGIELEVDSRVYASHQRLIFWSIW